MAQIKGKQIQALSITDAQLADDCITSAKLADQTSTLEFGPALTTPALHAVFSTGEDLTLGVGTIEILNTSADRSLTVDVANGFQVQNTAMGAEAYILPGTISLLGATLSPALPTAPEHVTTKVYVDDISGTLDTTDVNMTPAVTVGNLSDTTLTISHTPSGNGSVFVHVNGALVPVNTNPIQPAGSCFFSPDGTTIRNFGSIVAGDVLYWNGVIAGFELDGDDRVTFVYDRL